MVVFFLGISIQSGTGDEMNDPEYPNAPPWIEEMLAENPLAAAHRKEREQEQIENIIRRVEAEQLNNPHISGYPAKFWLTEEGWEMEIEGRKYTSHT